MDNAQGETPFESAARPQMWVMRSLSTWIRRMATGPASRASNTSGNTIGAQAMQQAHWLGRRTDRIQRAAAWNGELGTVSPALVDRFAQRVANRVQRSRRAHQADAYAGGDNIDRQLDMPLVSNEGSLTPLSEGNSDETPFAFGSFSPENVQRKPAPLQAEAPAALPPISSALRERAEQLRRSLATNTPAPALNPSANTPAIQAARPPAPPAPAPRAGVKRARPVTRIEELGPGRAPAPAPSTPPVPEPPKPAPGQVQRAAQTPAVRPLPATPMPNVQRAAVPPQVVQGQGRLTQMLNARFRPKQDEARNPDAPHAETHAGDDFTGDGDVTSDDAPRILRSAMRPVERNAQGVSDDLPVPTPMPPVPKPITPTVHRKAEAPAQTPSENISDSTPRSAPANMPASEPPAIQREAKIDAARDTDLPLASPAAPAKASVVAHTEPPAISDAPSVQRDMRESASSSAQTPSIKTSAPPAVTHSIQREVKTDAVRNVDLPLAAPASPIEANVDVQTESPAVSHAPVIQREVRENASPAANIVQRSATPASGPSQQAATPPSNVAPVDLALRMPRSAADASIDSPAGTVQRNAVTETPTPVTGDVVQRDAVAQTSESKTTPAQVESHLPGDEAPEMVQRMAVNAPSPADASSDDLADVDQAMPLVQRGPAASENADAQTDAALVSAFAVAAAKQQTISHDNSGDLPSTLPLHQNAPAPAQLMMPATPAVQRNAAPAGDIAPATESRRDADAPVSERNIGLIQRAPATQTRDDAEALTLQTPAAQPERAPARGAELPSSTPASQATAPIAGAPAVQRDVNRSESTPAQRSVMPSANIPFSPPAIQSNNEAEMVLRSSARQAQPEAQPETQTKAPFVMRDAPVANAIAASEPPPAVGRRKAASNSLSRMAGVAIADMPVLRAMAGAAAEGVMQPEVRALTMPIVQRAAVKHEQQAAQSAQARPVNPFVEAQARASEMPVVQRALVDEAPEASRGEGNEAAKVSMPARGATQAPAKARAISDAELTMAAQRILPIIKRLLAIERERLLGR